MNALGLAQRLTPFCPFPKTKVIEQIQAAIELLRSPDHPRLKFFDENRNRFKLTPEEVIARLELHRSYKICGTPYKINRIFLLPVVDAAKAMPEEDIPDWVYAYGDKHCPARQGRSCILPSIEWVWSMNGRPAPGSALAA